ncbi:MAG: DUF433 domain-containing protein [Acidobacteriota bacterium]|nr:DUF433 domain-containing protein [Acidobacteriota bacterium]
MSRRKQNVATLKSRELVREVYAGDPYVYLPLGKYVVAARGVCGGRPTIKYHRLDARHVIGYLKQGVTPEEIAADFKIPMAAVREVIRLADVYDYEASYV